MKTAWKKLSLGFLFLSTYLLTAYTGSFFSQREFGFQYDVSFLGLLCFLWVMTLIGGCTLLVLCGLLVTPGGFSRLAVLLIVLSTAVWLVYLPGWPVNLFIFFVVTLSVELTLLFARPLRRRRHVGLTMGVLFVPYLIYLIILLVRTVFEGMNWGFSAATAVRIIVLSGLAVLPILSVSVAVRYPDVLLDDKRLFHNTKSRVDVSESPRGLSWYKGVIISPFLLFVALMASVVFYFQQSGSHQSNYGHNPPHGLHADIVEIHTDIGIPGISKVYEAHLFNFSYFPVVVEACGYEDDTGSYSSQLAYAVQRWKAEEHRYVDVAQLSGEKFCKPYPLGIVQAKSLRVLLFPGHSLLTNWEASATRFEKGDKARFVVLSRLDATSSSKRYAFPTSEFTIDEEVLDKETPYRITH